MYSRKNTSETSMVTQDKKGNNTAVNKVTDNKFISALVTTEIT